MLTLDKICGYLPYGLKVWNNKDQYPYELLALEKDNMTLESGDMSFYWCKPILRPLSDLTKEITVNGETFVPKDRLREISGAFEPDEEFKNPFSLHFIDKKIIGFSALCMHVDQLQLFQKLYEWHFDIHSLIESGDAISIHDIK